MGKDGIAPFKQIFDISVPISEKSHVFPGDPPVSIEKTMRIAAAGDDVNVSILTLGTHTGTHVDPELHLVANGKGIDEVPMDRLIGWVKVFDLPDLDIKIGREDLEALSIEEGDMVLLKTPNSSVSWDGSDFDKDFIYLSHEAAGLLTEKKVKTVGVDYISVDGYRVSDMPTHMELKKGGVCVIEGLRLDAVPEGTYLMVCLPLYIEGGDGGVARAVLLK